MKNKVITFGEIMLRLKSPGFERFLQSPKLEATFGGGESNVAVSLAGFGVEVSFVTVLPNNDIADRCISYLKSRNIDTSEIIRAGQRMGIYFLETGANQRPSKVIYDRSFSSFSIAHVDLFKWDKIFKKASWFHVSGITPALNQTAADNVLAAVKKAKELGLTVSCDYNFRKNLWKYGKQAQEVMPEIVKYIDIGFANEEDCQLSLGVSIENGDLKKEINDGVLDISKYKSLCHKVMEIYPNITKQAITLRESHSATYNSWSACLCNGSDFFLGEKYDIKNIVDRVGGGDSFAAGLIYALISGYDDREALSFANAASCIKHSICGDANLATVKEVESLIKGDKSGRVRR